MERVLRGGGGGDCGVDSSLCMHPPYPLPLLPPPTPPPFFWQRREQPPRRRRRGRLWLRMGNGSARNQNSIGTRPGLDNLAEDHRPSATTISAGKTVWTSIAVTIGYLGAHSRRGQPWRLHWEETTQNANEVL